MPFEKGKSKTGGRKRGKKNKATEDLRKSISDLIDHNWPSLQNDLEHLDAKDRLLFMEKMMAYILPKPQTIDVKADVNTRLDSMSDSQINALIDQILKPHSP
ncbi:hypothetical protein GCM10028808_60710 [Spirosoma migulaei]